MKRIENDVESSPWKSGRRSEPGPRRIAGEELAVLILAVLVLVLPALVGGHGGGEPTITHREVEPLLIDVDTASWYEWALLDGIGEVRARRIVEYVRANRPITSLDQLSAVPGLPVVWIERARPFLGLRGVRVRDTNGARR